jgi:hypothetical protein
VPGRRNYARERAQHALLAPHQYQAIHHLLITQLPHLDHPLAGHHAILHFLVDRLWLRRPNGHPISWRMVLRWTRLYGFPLLHGGWHPKRRRTTPSLSTTFAVTAWVLSRFNTAQSDLFRVCIPSDAGIPEGRRAA